MGIKLSECRYGQAIVIQPFNDNWLIINNENDRKRYNELHNWLWWVNKNICQLIEKDYYNTTMVKLRIATGMLNKLESLTEEEKTQIHWNFTNNVLCEFWYAQEKNLPF